MRQIVHPVPIGGNPENETLAVEASCILPLVVVPMGLDLHISTQPLHTLGKPSQTITRYPHFETWGMMHSCETVNSGLIQTLMVFDTYCPRARGLQLSCLWLVGLLPDWKIYFMCFELSAFIAFVWGCLIICVNTLHQQNQPNFFCLGVVM